MTPPELVEREQVEAFQRAHRNHLGQALKVDGDLGPQTRWARDFATICHARQSIVLTAQPFIGLCEVPPGSNSDPDGLILAWLRRCWAKPHDPWCAAFVSWCLSQGVPRAIRQGGAQALGRMFPETQSPMAGDLFWYPTGQSTGHVGIVSGSGAIEIMSLEGNCDNAVRCARRFRVAPGGPRLRFSRTVEDVSGTPPGVVPSVLWAPGGTR